MKLNLFSVQMTFHVSIMWPECFCRDLQILAHLIDVPAHGRVVGLNDL